MAQYFLQQANWLVLLLTALAYFKVLLQSSESMIRPKWLHAVKLLRNMENCCTTMHAYACQGYSSRYSQRKEGRRTPSSWSECVAVTAQDTCISVSQTCCPIAAISGESDIIAAHISDKAKLIAADVSAALFTNCQDGD